jgi:hypothetical protein
MSSAEEDSSKESRISCISAAKVLPFGTGLANPNADNLFLATVLGSHVHPAYRALPLATVRSGEPT